MEKNVRWAYDFFEEMSLNATGAYVNYIDPLLHDWDKKYYAANYDRLLAIKKTVDPDRMFHFQQGVGSKFNPTAKLTDLSPLESHALSAIIAPARSFGNEGRVGVSSGGRPSASLGKSLGCTHLSANHG